MSINIENATKWIEALESGEYPQGKDELRSDFGYCCLGVLCDLSGQGEWRKSRHSSTFRYSIQGDTYGLKAFPRTEVTEGFLGEDASDRGDVKINKKHLTEEQLARVKKGWLSSSDTVLVSILNDSDFSFAEIAAVLRKQFGLPARDAA